MLSNKIFIVIGIISLAAATLLGNIYIQQRQNSKIEAADILPSQCRENGGFVWNGQSCPAGYQQKGIIGGNGDNQQGGSLCCAPRVTPQNPTLTRVPTRTPIPPTPTRIPPTPSAGASPTPSGVVTPTLTPSPTPACPDCAPPETLPQDPAKGLVCNQNCNFFLQDENSCPSVQDFVRIRLDTDGCVTYDIDGDKITQCGKKGDILRFRPSRSGKITVSMSCTIYGSVNEELECNKKITVTCEAPTPTKTSASPVPSTPLSCKLPIPKLLFQCQHGCQEIKL